MKGSLAAPWSKYIRRCQDLMVTLVGPTGKALCELEPGWAIAVPVPSSRGHDEPLASGVPVSRVA